MDKTPVFLVFILPWFLLILFTLRPGGPEKSYEWNLRYVPFLLPGKWKDKTYFVFWTRRLARLWLAVLALISFLIFKTG